MKKKGDALLETFAGEPRDRVEAMTRILVLAIMADTEDQCDRAAELAAEISVGLTLDQINRARLSAEALLQEHFG